MAQEVIIVDAHGIEHVFPEGFDPKKAAAIVKESTQRPLDVHDANTGNQTLDTLMGMHRGLNEGVLGGAKGFVRGVVPGAYHAVVGAIPGIVNAVLGTAKGTGRLLSDPVATLTEAYNTVSGTPGKATEMLQSALELATKDPEAFGRAVGEVTGGLEAGIGLSGLVPLAPKPIARVVGPTIEGVAKHGKWPIRMMGAHQLGSGNPMGLLTMMVPEGLQKTGTALTRFGESEPAITAKAIEQFRGQKAPPVKQQPVRIAANKDSPLGHSPDIIERNLKTTARPEEKYSPAELKDQRVAAAEAKRLAIEQEKEAANQERLDAIIEARGGLEPRKPTFNKTMSATSPKGGRESMSQSYGRPKQGEGTIEDELLSRGLDPSRIKSVIEGTSRTGVPLKSVPKHVEPPVSPMTPEGIGQAEIKNTFIPTPLLDAIEKRGIPLKRIQIWLDKISKKALKGQELTPEQTVEMIQDLGISENDVLGIHEWVASNPELNTLSQNRPLMSPEQIGQAEIGEFRSGANLPGNMRPSELAPQEMPSRMTMPTDRSGRPVLDPEGGSVGPVRTSGPATNARGEQIELSPAGENYFGPERRQGSTPVEVERRGAPVGSQADRNTAARVENANGPKASQDPEAIVSGRNLEQSLGTKSVEPPAEPVAPLRNALEQEQELRMLQNQLKADALKKLNLPTTRSRRGVLELNPDATEGDAERMMEILWKHPNISRENATRMLIQGRKGASSTYANNAVLDKLYQRKTTEPEY